MPMGRLRRIFRWDALARSAVVVGALGWSWQMPASAAADQKPPPKTAAPKLQGEADLMDRQALRETYTDDLDALIRRRVIRVLTTYNKTNFFIVDGPPRGFEYDLLKQYQAYLKTRVNKRSWPVTFLFIPVPFSDLLPALIEGRGDIAAAGLTITPERERRVAFTNPYISDVKEVVVTSRSVTGLETLDDLSGRRVYVDPQTSYAQSLRALGEKFAKRGLKPVEIVDADPKLLTEDILDLVNAGIVDLTITDNHLAELWSAVLPNIKVRNDLALRQGGRIAWAVRKNNPELRRSLNSAIAKFGKGTKTGNILYSRYFEDSKWITNPLSDKEIEKLVDLETLFKKYGEKYGFDWRTIAAVAFQESKLNQTVRSKSGAVGLMQIKPQTAKADPINISNISKLENNIHAGVKYMAFLREKYFGDPKIKPADRLDFVLAAYNAGPTRIDKLRRLAKNKGLAANRWFFNVEQIARQSGLLETVRYVANVNKYYIAYKLSAKAYRERAARVRSIKQSGAN
jgi:membrane-bound lytic murein transglycosylase MltF